jgi:hypothetical protein
MPCRFSRIHVWISYIPGLRPLPRRMAFGGCIAMKNIAMWSRAGCVGVVAGGLLSQWIERPYSRRRPAEDRNPGFREEARDVGRDLE